MSKIAEKRTDEIVGEYHDGDYTDHSRHNTQWVAFKQGYDQAMQDIFNYLEANIPCGEMSSEDVRDFIIECKEYFKWEN